MIVRIRLDWDSSNKVDHLTYEELCEICDACSKDKPEPTDHRYFGLDHVVDLARAVATLDKFGLKYEVRPFKQNYLQHIPAAQAAGSIINVHIPNIGLLAINEVTVQNDCCTDHLQEMLNEGWRIIAVCPPNSVRRPDYVLGRTV